MKSIFIVFGLTRPGIELLTVSVTDALSARSLIVFFFYLPTHFAVEILTFLAHELKVFISARSST